MNKKTRREEAKRAKAEKSKPVEQAAATDTTPKAAKVKKEAKPGATSAMAAMPKLPKLPSASRARKPKPFVKCTCGCGTDTRSMWAPGHDARARGWAMRVERGICAMKDVPENEQPGAKFMLKQRKELGTEGAIKLVKGKKNKEEAAATEPAAEAVGQ